jgi:hypothetical protein
MKIIALVEVCSNKTYNKIGIGEHQSNISTTSRGLKQECIFAIAFRYSLPYANSKFHGKYWGLKSDGKRQLWFYACEQNMGRRTA